VFNGDKSAYTSCYSRFDVPGVASKVIVVVKVNQSVEAPHAIENSTRVYVRTGNLSQPYQLADMSTLEYLFKRRQNSELKRESIIATAASRSTSGTQYGLTILICPTFPSVPLRSLDEIEDFVAEQPSTYPEKYFYDSMRRIQDGMLNTAQQHLELNKYGLVFHAGTLEVGNAGAEKVPYTQFAALVSRIATVSRFAYDFVQDTVTNLLVRVLMFKFDGVWLQFRLSMGDEVSAPGANYSCIEDRITAETTTTIEGLREGLVETITNLTEQILWSFNRREPKLKSFVEEILKKSRQLF
jgi:hypothetical protein